MNTHRRFLPFFLSLTLSNCVFGMQPHSSRPLLKLVDNTLITGDTVVDPSLEQLIERLEKLEQIVEKVQTYIYNDYHLNDSKEERKEKLKQCLITTETSKENTTPQGITIINPQSPFLMCQRLPSCIIQKSSTCDSKGIPLNIKDLDPEYYTAVSQVINTFDSLDVKNSFNNKK